MRCGERSDDAALLFGRLLIHALLLPGGIEKLLGFSKFAASLSAKGLPYAKVLAGVDVGIEMLGPIALIIGLWPRWTALVLIGFTAVTLWLTHRHAGVGVVFRPRQIGEILESLAVMGGLLFYFVSGPGSWSRASLRG